MAEDRIKVVTFDKVNQSIHLRIRGTDRPNVVADVAGRLEKEGLYVASIVFNLASPLHEEYEMEVVAKGELAGLQAVEYLVEVGDFAALPSQLNIKHIFWPEAYFFHVSLKTPDREGLTAKISSIIGKPRQVSSDNVCPNGSFVHMLGLIHNSDGPMGGTSYFSLRATVATQVLDVQEQIIDHLHDWALKYGIEGDLWTQDLNRKVDRQLAHSD
jgi:hypothetical protein